jgi:hypothetical protein
MMNNINRCSISIQNIKNIENGRPLGMSQLKRCEELLHTFTTKICTHNKNPVGSGTIM